MQNVAGGRPVTKEEIKTALEALVPGDWTRHARMDWWWCKQGYFRWAVKRHHEDDWVATLYLAGKGTGAFAEVGGATAEGALANLLQFIEEAHKAIQEAT